MAIIVIDKLGENKMRIEEQPICTRPYEKFLNQGATHLTDTELLAIVLRSGTTKMNVLELAQYLLKGEADQYQLVELYGLSYEELLKVHGIGTVKATQILAVLELSKRLAMTKYSTKPKLQSPEVIATYFMEEFRHKKEEHFAVVLLDTKCKMIEYKVVFKGSLNASIVHPREVYKYAILKSACSIIVMHNHPSGDPMPSRADITITKKLLSVGETMSIPLVDHIIIGDMNYISLKEQGYL